VTRQNNKALENQQKPIYRSPRLLVSLSPRLVSLALTLGFLALYVRTAAPTVLSGDSAEFQFAAPLLGVSHPTTYPLYTLLGYVATVVLPGDVARRVTLLSALCAALAVGLFFLPARRVTGSTGAAMVAALALGVAPGLWNAATIAEVYALLALLLVALGYALSGDVRCTMYDVRLRRGARRAAGTADTADAAALAGTEALAGAAGTEARPYITRSPAHPLTRSPAHPLTRSPAHPLTRSPAHPLARVRPAAFVAGLGCTHHGLFVLTGLPVFVGYAFRQIAEIVRGRDGNTSGGHTGGGHTGGGHGGAALQVGMWFVLGLAPLLYPIIQFARNGPYAGGDWGLPERYFWGGPATWGEVFDLMTGGDVRRGIFQLPSFDEALQTLQMVGSRMWFEFGPLGVLLGIIGCVLLLRQHRGVWFCSVWVFLATLTYLLLLGPAVQDAPVFTLPMLLPWALWIGVSAAALASLRQRGRETGRAGDPERERVGDPETRRPGDRAAQTSAPTPVHPFTRSPVHPFTPSTGHALITLLIVVTLVWGYTRTPHSSKRRLWLFQEFGRATLSQLPPNAVVITHWEHGTTLQYLIAVEGMRPDVQVDTVEPGDADWGDYARTRYTDRSVFFVGRPADVADLPVETVRDDSYAYLFRLIDDTRP
jgi:hypothetical protein